ncbi:conserved oligomeric Golgi complex subunit 8 isoform X2 [Sminthopsis crassicaudata]|uniref:conserved oligomeric Golgi complex subunit 8 isoform X2 n=1 Tax=Sminthopsis crassicaudata TaxID=9301 RepID=UPI003D69C483
MAMGRPWEKLLSLARGCGCAGAASAPPVEGPVLRRPWTRVVRRWLLRPPEPPYKHVCQVGEPALRAVAAPVDPALLAGPEAQALIARLVRVMRARGAVGLSAPQLGVPLQVLALEFPERLLLSYPPAVRQARRMATSPLRVFVNPQVRVLDSRLVSFPEGCLSVAGFVACVPRCQAVQIEGLNENGEPVVWQASGWLARIIQHEMDHLQGCLFIDKMDSKTFTNVRWMEVND